MHNGSVCFWICANIIWMIGEFYFNERSRVIALVFFFGVIILLIGYYSYETVRKFRGRGRADIAPAF